MKKWISLILALMLLLGLTACGEEKGITILNELGWDLEDIYIVTAGAESWGEKPVIGYLDDGVGGYLYPETTFGSRDIRVDILAVDEDGDWYEAYDIPMKDGDSCTLELTDDAEFVVRVGDKTYTGDRGFAEDDPEPDEISDGSEYWGFYQIPDEGFLTVYEDGTFEVLDLEGEVFMSGTCQFEDGLTLISDDGESIFLMLDEDHNLYGGEDVGTLFWIDPNEQPVDDPNYSYGEADFLGYWMYDNGYILQIAEDGWYLYDQEGRLLQYGPVEYGDSEALLMNEDGSSGGGHVYFDEYGDLIDSGEMLTYWNVFPYGNSENQQNEYLEGEWYYTAQEFVLYFDGINTFTLEGPDLYVEGTYVFDGEDVSFYDDEGSEMDGAYLDSEDCLWLVGDESGNWFYRNE